MATAPQWIRQSAAIPVRDNLVCLITSSNGRRWVIPKGMMEPGKSAAEIALQEAWEEAGLVGMLAQQPVGTYFYEKYDATCHVTVFRMEVIDVVEVYPESTLRRREWLPLEEALERIEEPALRDLLRQAFTLECGLPD